MKYASLPLLRRREFITLIGCLGPKPWTGCLWLVPDGPDTDR